MRLIFQSESEESARLFADWLLAKNTKSQVEHNGGGQWEVWVLDEAQLESSAALLERFLSNPDDPEFAAAEAVATQLRREEARDLKAAAKRMKGPADLFVSAKVGRLTLVLILSSVLVALLTKLGGDTRAAQPLMISAYRVLGGHAWWEGLPEIKSGQVWRLFTPIFLHFGVLHLLFNMLWMRDLGSMVERVQGTLRLALLVLVIAVLSNLAQYAVSGPSFGGMSGVVYGLLGYIWMQGKYNPGCGLFLHSSTVTMMLAWFFICLFGFMPIANTVHAVGLGVGIAWGYIEARMRR